ncbi:peritrophin-1-like [Malaya genurostris]|uniref:peritrophin-1-like n=1 Tax=Malaya genurostris TaxID=325434 RepID=UPI0026F3E2E1|nr:peritrophin-1-like [Malaya genurostris]
MLKASISITLATIAVLCVIPSLANRCTGKPDGLFINDFTACDRYFVCTRQMPVPGRCPNDLYFNEEEQKCDHSWNVICLLCGDPNEEPTTITTPESPTGPDETETQMTLMLEPSETVENFPIEYECGKYTACFDGEGFLMECAPELFFNPESRRCEIPDDNSCDRSCPSNVNPSVPTFVPDLTDCSSYFICFNRTSTAQSCAGGMLFNPDTRKCDFPENVDCDHVTPIITECQPNGMHYIPHEESCTSFFVCVNGENRGEQECADSLLFDIDTMTCREAELATCTCQECMT